ncbi:helix-turn-helix domain-containing protein [Microbacterium sp. P04]|uniref:helix-turn-helix domain-containing protein n=1 Tax=Microbacterium sp. P04 TaxID=3366947 RepID=UPI003746E3A4
MFGARVRALRKKQGFSQETLAHEVGVTKNHMQLIEAGRSSSAISGPPSNPRMSTVYGIAAALGVHPSELIP